MLSNAVLAACDAKDGIEDGILNDPGSCTFDPAVLLCTETNKENCLTAAQIETARKAYDGVKTKAGQLVYPGSAFGFETGWRMPQPGSGPPAVALDTFRYLGHQDANWNGMSFDLDKDLALAVENAGFIDAISPDLSKFKARGGKLLMYHGWADPGPAPANTINGQVDMTRPLCPYPQIAKWTGSGSTSEAKNFVCR